MYVMRRVQEIGFKRHVLGIETGTGLLSLRQ